MIVLLADVELAADDRLDSLLLRGIYKMDRAIDVAMVGHGHGLLPDLAHTRHQLLDVAGAVEERVIGMQMEMDEFGHGWVSSHYSCRDLGEGVSACGKQAR